MTERHHIEARPDFLERALRACASVGVFTEDASGRFGPTALSEVLTRDAPGSQKRFAELFGGPWWQPWGALADALRTGEAQRAGGPGRQPFDYAGNPEGMRRFAEAMRSGAVAIRPALGRLDLSGARTLVDVGGGGGHLAAVLLARHPDLRACVLELAELVPVATALAADEAPDVARRLTFVAGDMFAEVPQGDVYLLSRILHDWDDVRCLRLLGNCAARMEHGGRVICIDHVLPPLGDTSDVAAKFLDLNMMVTTPGKERTRRSGVRSSPKPASSSRRSRGPRISGWRSSRHAGAPAERHSWDCAGLLHPYRASGLLRSPLASVSSKPPLRVRA